MDPFLGEIRLFAFRKVPTRWLACNGQAVSVQEYNALAALLGTTYGGDGTTTIGLPNLNGAVPIGQGTGTGLSPRTLSQTGGAETVALTLAEVPSHTHVYQATTASDTTGAIGPTVTFAGDSTNTEKHYVSPLPTTPSWRMLASNAVSNAGGNAAHANVMPGLGLNYCICVVGMWPQNPN